MNVRTGYSYGGAILQRKAGLRHDELVCAKGAGFKGNNLVGAFAEPWLHRHADLAHEKLRSEKAGARIDYV